MTSIPKTRPEGAQAVPIDFFGCGFESGLVPHCNNDFSENVMNAIGSHMSKPLVIRAGGTSGDHNSFNRNQSNGTYCRSGRESVPEGVDEHTSPYGRRGGHGKYRGLHRASLEGPWKKSSGSIVNSPSAFGGGFGVALWAVDVHLAARMCNTQEPAATHSFWVPDNSGSNHSDRLSKESLPQLRSLPTS
ncbi:unnamed protein product [Penicillium pancosmium]